MTDDIRTAHPTLVAPQIVTFWEIHYAPFRRVYAMSNTNLILNVRVVSCGHVAALFHDAHLSIVLADSNNGPGASVRAGARTDCPGAWLRLYAKIKFG